VLAVAFGIAVAGTAAPAHADETDNFTCRSRLRRDAAAAIDILVNARIERAIARANARGLRCDHACLARLLREEVGRSSRQPLTFVPHATLAREIGRAGGIERCHLKFGETIYGARPYNQPWLSPFLGRIIFVADSMLVSGHVIGLDKIEHFIREGLEHWRDTSGGMSLAASIAREQGKDGGRLAWTERGVKGAALTGVFAYADLAAGYSGHRFWRELLSIEGPDAFVTGGSGTFVLQRRFSISSYVTAAWDEAVNCSTFHPDLKKEVAAALAARRQSCPITDCRQLATLSDASLYVNPQCQPAASLLPEPDDDDALVLILGDREIDQPVAALLRGERRCLFAELLP
jgi:hypothetical protein